MNHKELVTAIKELQQTLGLGRTESFTRHSEDQAAGYRCYYTGKLELPESYDGLKLQSGTKDGCALDPEEFDIFFYPLEASATAEQPVTASLARASTERFLVVVPHEDFHHTLASPGLPPEFSEAASTLLGFLTAAELARQRFGEESTVFQNLACEPELFLRKAEIVNRHHARLSELYARVRTREVAEPEAREQKAAQFQALGRECQALSPMPVSFSRCLAADNNAGLAFDRTYTKHYPRMFEVYLTSGRNLGATVEAVRYLLAAGSEAEALARLDALLGRASGSAASSAAR